jgi:hypothetical protein
MIATLLKEEADQHLAFIRHRRMCVFCRGMIIPTCDMGKALHKKFMDARSKVSKSYG